MARLGTIIKDSIMVYLQEVSKLTGISQKKLVEESLLSYLPEEEHLYFQKHQKRKAK